MRIFCVMLINSALFGCGQDIPDETANAVRAMVSPAPSYECPYYARCYVDPSAEYQAN